MREAKTRQSCNNFMVGSLQTGYRDALSFVCGNGSLRVRLYIFFFAGRDFLKIRRVVHVTYDRVQWRVVIASDSIKAANLSST
jgi:hypothetical protein